MSSDLKKRMRDNFKQSCNGHQAHNDINIVDRDMLSNPSMECDDNNVTNTQCIIIESDSDVDILESSSGTQQFPSSHSVELAYLQGNGDISPDIPEEPTLEEIRYAQEKVLDCNDAEAIAALIFVIDKCVECSCVTSAMDKSLIQSRKFEQFADITRSLDEKLVTDGNKLRFLADKISQNIHLDSVEGSHQNTQNMDCDQNGAGGENSTCR